jgi:hypothetical protein
MIARRAVLEGFEESSQTIGSIQYDYNVPRGNRGRVDRRGYRVDGLIEPAAATKQIALFGPDLFVCILCTGFMRPPNYASRFLGHCLLQKLSDRTNNVSAFKETWAVKPILVLGAEIHNAGVTPAIDAAAKIFDKTMTAFAPLVAVLIAYFFKKS